MPIRVLFLCTSNSTRSQMAEGLLRHLAGERCEVYRTGREPKASIHLPVKSCATSVLLSIEKVMSADQAGYIVK